MKSWVLGFRFPLNTNNAIRGFQVSSFRFQVFKQKPEKPFLWFAVPMEPCAECYGFVFKNKLLRQSHISHHITVVITNHKKKNPASQKNLS